ncbi:MAG: MBL fold metallo-hydrolase [Rhodobacteraceae bacterium]|nr:MBL fold metallo-hydrolase [Paracoccaceae bacterium]
MRPVIKNYQRLRSVFSWPFGIFARLTAALILLFSFTNSASAVCQLLARAPEARVQLASLKADEIKIRYIGHSTFELETPMGIRIATDYSDRYQPELIPTIVTMNRAHSSHYTLAPSPEIKHVLTGWNPEGGPIDHDLFEGDVRVRNIQTNIRNWVGETERLGNSIFIFEVADLCLAHLGHLHHRLTEDDLLRLGQIDVVFAAIDNSNTLRVDSLMDVLEAISPSVVIPMHFHFAGALETFTQRALAQGFAMNAVAEPDLILSRATLPARKSVYLMHPEKH